MPAPGDQHDAIANPFEEAIPRVSQFTASEIATLQSRLEKKLGPEYLSARSGPSGQKVHYIAAEKCIALANDVFGFNGWSSSIQNIQVDFVDENTQTGKISLGLSVIVRVTLRDGTFHEDIGYGHIENCKGKAAAFEKAKKEGTTDGLKRALRNFGNVLGNCIYDKDYLAKVTKMKVAPTKFDADNLHRHSDFMKKEPEPKIEAKVEAKVTATSGAEKSNDERSAPIPSLAPNVSDSLDEEFGDFDMADFGVTEGDHPDEVVLPASSHATNANDKPVTISSGHDASKNPTNSANGSRSMQLLPNAAARNGINGNAPRQPPQTPQPNRPGAPFQGCPVQQQGRPSNGAPVGGNPTTANKPSTPGANGEQAAPVGFLSARSADLLPKDLPVDAAPPVPAGARLFDPRADSPSIRKTPGIDHRTSKPVGRDGQHVPPMKRDEEPPRVGGAGFSTGHGNGTAPTMGRPSIGNNVVNPSLNQTRQIGAPGGMSPMGTRQFRQPMKRPAPGANGGTRPPLNEVTTNGTVVAGAASVIDAKRQKTN